jgi:hypothetical protein
MRGREWGEKREDTEREGYRSRRGYGKGGIGEGKGGREQKLVTGDEGTGRGIRAGKGFQVWNGRGEVTGGEGYGQGRIRG